LKQKHFIIHKKQVTGPYFIYLLIFLFLSGCATAPTYTSVLTDDYIQLKAPKQFNSLSLGFVLTENTQKTIQFIEEHNSYSNIKAHDALIYFDSQFVIERAKKILESRFKSVVQTENINDAAKEDIDIFLLFDYRIEVDWIRGHPSYIFLEGVFVDSDGKVIDKIISRYDKVVALAGGIGSLGGSPEGGRFKPVAEEGLIKFTEELDKSKGLIAFSNDFEQEMLISSLPEGLNNSMNHISEYSNKDDYSNVSFGKYHAIVIGNNDYKYLPELNTAINDAKTVATILKNIYGFETKLIINGTRRDILVSFDKYRSELEAKDNLLIYYAGHGYYDNEAERGYWLPVDAKSNTKADWISNADISDSLKTFRAKHVLIVADSCYSGTLTRGIKVNIKSPDYFQRIAQKKSRTVLTSGGLEPVMDSGGGDHSVFCKAFIDILNDNKGFLDGTQLFSKIRRPVSINAPQTPQYSDIRFAGHDGGDFIFVRIK